MFSVFTRERPFTTRPKATANSESVDISQLLAGKSVEMSQVQCLKCSYPAAVGSDEMKDKKDER